MDLNSSMRINDSADIVDFKVVDSISKLMNEVRFDFFDDLAAECINVIALKRSGGAHDSCHSRRKLSFGTRLLLIHVKLKSISYARASENHTCVRRTL